MAVRVVSWSCSSLIPNPALDSHAPCRRRIATSSKPAAMQTQPMKMAGPVLRWRSSSSPGLIGLIPNPISCAFSGAAFEPEAPSRRTRTIPIASKLAKAQSSIHWELFKSWMAKHNKHDVTDENMLHNKHGVTDENMLHRFGIFIQNLKDAEKRNKQIERNTIRLNRLSDKLNYIKEMKWKIRRRYPFMFLDDLQYDDPYKDKPKPKVSDFKSAKVVDAQSSQHWEVFQSWMSKYNREYKSDQELLYRFEIFVNNLKFMEEMNKRISRYTKYASFLRY